ncbi:MAG: hypothetical protein HY924_10555 [Elusimicrobia bacterium]|nr:hypothetical protein [Elusimicrobiota bacterium]
MNFKTIRRPLAVLVVSALLVASQGLAVPALAQTITTPNTGKTAPASIPAAGAFSGISAAGSQTSFSPSAVSFNGSVVGLLSAPDIAAGTGEALPRSAVPVLASPVFEAQVAPSVQVQGRSSVETAVPAGPAPSFQAPTSDETSAAPSSQVSRTVEGKEGLTGLRKLTGALSKVGESISLRRFFDGGMGASVPGGESLSPSAVGDGQARAKAEPDLSKVKVYLTRHGSDPVETDLKSLSSLLASDPAYLESLNKKGRVRLIIGEGAGSGTLTRADESFIRRTVESYGVTARVDVEKLSVSAPKKAQEVEALETSKGSSSIWRKALSVVTAPFREIVYLLRTLKTSFTKPSAAEAIGGLVSKAVPFIMGLSWWWTTFMPGAPVMWAAAVGYSLALNVFHGVFIDTWNTFQNRIGKQRGLQYQTVFNFLYGQIPGMIFRIMVWTVVASTVPPWALGYWRDIGIATIIGTFCGTLGYQGLNGLYDKGILSRGWRSGFQQVRDIFFNLGGIFFGTGSMAQFWVIFLIQQSLDVALYIVSRRMAKRPIAYVADADLASSPDFQGMYPVKPGTEESPLKQALKNILEFLPIKLTIQLAKYLYRLLKKKNQPSSPTGK